MPTASIFQLGQIVATPAAIAAFEAAHQSPQEFLQRHAKCDWGDLGPSDKRANYDALGDGSRIFSAYRLSDGTKIWIITEAEYKGSRASTCILLPSDY